MFHYKYKYSCIISSENVWCVYTFLKKFKNFPFSFYFFIHKNYEKNCLFFVRIHFIIVFTMFGFKTSLLNHKFSLLQMIIFYQLLQQNFDFYKARNVEVFTFLIYKPKMFCVRTCVETENRNGKIIWKIYLAMTIQFNSQIVYVYVHWSLIICEG